MSTVSEFLSFVSMFAFIAPFIIGGILLFAYLFRNMIKNAKTRRPYPGMTDLEKKLRIVQGSLIGVMMLTMTGTLALGHIVAGDVSTISQLPLPILACFGILIICGAILAVVTMIAGRMQQFRRLSYVYDRFQDGNYDRNEQNYYL